LETLILRLFVPDSQVLAVSGSSVRASRGTVVQPSARCHTFHAPPESPNPRSYTSRGSPWTPV